MGLLDSIFGSDDPSTADPNTGLTSAQRSRVATDTLGSIGAQLLAAGQNIMPAQRAQILAGMGSIPLQTQQQISDMARTKLMNTQGIAAKQKAAQQAELVKQLSSPEFAAQLQTLPPDLRAAAIASAKAGDIATVTKLLADNSRDTRQDKLFTQQQTLADRRAQQQLAHDDKKPIALGNGSFLDRSKGLIYTVDPLTAAVTTTPMDGQSGLPQLPQAAPQVAPQQGTPSPLTSQQTALTRPPPVMPQGSGEIDPQSGIPLPEPAGRNEEFLKTLPKEYQTLVKRLVDGQQAPPSLTRNNPLMLRVMSLASQYDPTFDTGNYPARVATRKDFASGAAAKNITSLNTAVQHLGTLHELGQQLNNGSLPLVNSLLNTGATQTGDNRVTNFEATKHAVAEEVSKVFKGSNLSDSEIKQWSTTLNAAMSPGQLQGAIENIVDLMHGRINALGDQYSRGMGGQVPGIQLLDKKSQEKLDFIQSHKIGTDWKAGGQQQAQLPPQAAARLEEGRQTTFGNGQVWTKRDGQPVRVK